MQFDYGIFTYKIVHVIKVDVHNYLSDLKLPSASTATLSVIPHCQLSYLSRSFIIQVTAVSALCC